MQHLEPIADKNVRGRELLEAAATKALESRVHARSQDVEDVLHSVLAVGRQAPERGATDHHGTCAERDGLHHIASASDSPIEDDVQVVAHRISDRRQCADRRRRFGAIAGPPKWEGVLDQVRLGLDDPVMQHLMTSDFSDRFLGTSGVAVELTLELWKPILAAAQQKGQLRADLDLNDAAVWLAKVFWMLVAQQSDSAEDRAAQAGLLHTFLVPAFIAR